MITYLPLWETMAQQRVTTYTLRFKYGMSHATVQRLQADLPVSTHTLDKLCTILNCPLEAVAVGIIVGIRAVAAQKIVNVIHQIIIVVLISHGIASFPKSIAQQL